MRRREFIRQASGAALTTAALAASGKVPAQARTAPDLIFLNGAVVTMNRAQPDAEAVAVRGGRVTTVGARKDIEALADGRTQTIDLQGRCLTPGLIDAHSHLVGFGQMELFFVKLRPPQVHDFDSLRGALAKAAARTPKGRWIVGRGFDEFDEGRFPRRQEIDGAAPNHPVLLIHWTGQYGIANTRALQAANLLRADVEDPYGGKYLRDRAGLPDGCLLHYPAIYSVYQPTMTSEEEGRAAEWGVGEFVKEGVTCVHDNFCNLGSARQYIRLEREGRLPLQVRLYPYVWSLQHCQQVLQQALRYSGPLVRMQGVKLAVDGYPLMYEVPAQQQRLNIPMHPQDQFEAIISAIHRASLQVDVHAAGDRGVDLTLDAFSKAAGGDQQVRDWRHRIEHFLFRRLPSIERAGNMGVPVCTQPYWIPIRAEELARKIDPAVVRQMAPMGSFRRAGVQICLGADVPASPSHLPLDSLRSAVTRAVRPGVSLDMDEAITFMEALEAHTLAAAYAAFDEKEMGSIETGKRADFALWNTDVRAVTGTAIRDLEVVATYLGGRQTYGSS